MTLDFGDTLECEKCGCGRRQSEGGTGPIFLPNDAVLRYGVRVVCGTCLYHLAPTDEVLRNLGFAIRGKA